MDRSSNAVSEREAAAAWHDRLHCENVPQETRKAFEAWLATNSRHLEVYESIDRAWSKLREAAEDPQILALRHETALRLTRRNSQTVRPLRWVAAAALLALGIGVTSLALRSPSDHFLIARLFNSLPLGNADHYETATGERLAFTLRDGSQVTLDTQSELKVDFSPVERRVRLTHGQAFFEIARGPGRPFVVEVHHRRFVAVGTAFDVRLDGDQVKVTMVEGTVRVERRDEAAPAVSESTKRNASGGSAGGVTATNSSPSQGTEVATITAGEQLVSDTQREDHVRTTDPERDTSWRRGQVIFDNTRLADAIAEVNRYSDAKIELADPDLADLRLSGAFATGRPAVFVEAVTSYFPVQVTRSDARGVVLSKKR
jgi:transmembrane sensor